MSLSIFKHKSQENQVYFSSRRHWKCIELRSRRTPVFSGSCLHSCMQCCSECS